MRISLTSASAVGRCMWLVHRACRSVNLRQPHDIDITTSELSMTKAIKYVLLAAILHPHGSNDWHGDTKVACDGCPRTSCYSLSLLCK